MRRRAGFTLVEVLAAIGLFSLMFLAAAGAVGSLAAEQSLNYQRAVSGAAMLLLADWHATRAVQQTPQLDFLTNASSSVPSTTMPLRLVAIPPALRFVGGEHDPGDAVLVFNPATITDTAADGAQLSLDAYRRLVLTLSSPSIKEADSGTIFRQLSFWQGSRDDVLAGKAGTVRFLARFLIADRCQP